MPIELTVCNLNGEPVNVHTGDRPKKTPCEPLTRRVDRHDAATISRGFDVTGVAPEGYGSAKDAAERAGRYFDARKYLRHAKHVRLRPEPYQLKEAAEQCAAMARRMGWQDVVVEEVLAVEVCPTSRGLL